MKPTSPLDLFGPRRPGAVLVSDRAGNPYWARLDESVEIADGVIRATGGGGSGTLVPLLTGEEPPVTVSDGAGSIIYISL